MGILGFLACYAWVGICDEARSAWGGLAKRNPPPCWRHTLRYCALLRIGDEGDLPAAWIERQRHVLMLDLPRAADPVVADGDADPSIGSSRALADGPDMVQAM